MKSRSNRWIALACILAVAAPMIGCAPGYYAQGPSRQSYETGAVGAGVGAAAGALLDKSNRWRGGVIGAGLGAVLGGAVGEIGNRAAWEAANQQRPVIYTNEPGNQRLEMNPVGTRGNCHIVKERYYEHGQLVRELEREVCD